MEINSNFGEAVKAAKATEGQQGKVWSGVVMFVNEHAFSKPENAKESFKAQEQAYEKAHKVKPSSLSAYRSAKSVAIGAIKHGIELLENGIPRGKTEVEKDLREVKKENKPAIDKWTQMFNNLNDMTDKLTMDSEIVQAMTMLDGLHKKVKKLFSEVTKLKEAA